MRIVGGEKRGRKLLSPEGLDTRPTADRTRESVFNILHHAKWREREVIEDALVLDVFAGTGALALEALSHGAKHAMFIEQNSVAIKVCQQNIAALEFDESRIRILKEDAIKLAPRPAGIEPRTLVFLDPPYGQGLGAKALERLVAGGWLAKGAICIFEMAKKQPEEIPQIFEQVDERAFGVALVKFLVWQG